MSYQLVSTADDGPLQLLTLYNRRRNYYDKNQLYQRSNLQP